MRVFCSVMGLWAHSLTSNAAWNQNPRRIHRHLLSQRLLTELQTCLPDELCGVIGGDHVCEPRCPEDQLGNASEATAVLLVPGELTHGVLCGETTDWFRFEQLPGRSGQLTLEAPELVDLEVVVVQGGAPIARKEAGSTDPMLALPAVQESAMLTVSVTAPGREVGLDYAIKFGNGPCEPVGQRQDEAVLATDGVATVEVCPHSLQWVRFAAEPGDRLRFNLRSLDAPSGPALDLYQTDSGQPLLSLPHATAEGEQVTLSNIAAEGVYVAVRNDAEVPQGVELMATVDGNDGCRDRFDPNGDELSAARISAGSWMDLRVCPRQRDVFELRTANDSSRPTVIVTRADSSYALTIEVRGLTSNTTTQTTLTPGVATSTLPNLIGGDTDYLVSVLGPTDEDGEVDPNRTGYGLQIGPSSATPPDEDLLNNHTPETAARLDDVTPVSGAVLPGAPDYFVFPTTNLAQVEVQIANTTPHLGVVELKVFGADGTPRGRLRAAGTTQLVAAVNGDPMVFVRLSADGGVGAGYTLQIRATSVSCVPDSDRSDPSDPLPLARGIGKGVACPGQDDYLAVDVGDGAKMMTVVLDPVGETGGLIAVDVIDPTGHTVWRAPALRAAPARTRVATVEGAGLPSGAYVARVRHLSDLGRAYALRAVVEDGPLDDTCREQETGNGTTFAYNDVAASPEMAPAGSVMTDPLPLDQTLGTCGDEADSYAIYVSTAGRSQRIAVESSVPEAARWTVTNERGELIGSSDGGLSQELNGLTIGWYLLTVSASAPTWYSVLTLPPSATFPQLPRCEPNAGDDVPDVPSDASVLTPTAAVASKICPIDQDFYRVPAGDGAGAIIRVTGTRLSNVALTADIYDATTGSVVQSRTSSGAEGLVFAGRFTNSPFVDVRVHAATVGELDYQIEYVHPAEWACADAEGFEPNQFSSQPAELDPNLTGGAGADLLQLCDPAEDGVDWYNFEALAGDRYEVTVSWDTSDNRPESNPTIGPFRARLKLGEEALSAIPTDGTGGTFRTIVQSSSNQPVLIVVDYNDAWLGASATPGPWPRYRLSVVKQ